VVTRDAVLGTNLGGNLVFNLDGDTGRATGTLRLGAASHPFSGVFDGSPNGRPCSPRPSNAANSPPSPSFLEVPRHHVRALGVELRAQGIGEGVDRGRHGRRKFPSLRVNQAADGAFARCFCGEN
jgi:hypothetical protein